MWLSPWLRYLPSLHKVNVPSCRDRPCTISWTAAHSEIPRLEKARLAVCQRLNMRFTPAGLNARIMGGILEACGSTITNRTAEKEMSMAPEKISNKGIIGEAGIPVSDKGFAVSWRVGKGLTLQEEKGGKKMSWAHGRSCSTSCRGWAHGLTKIRSNQPSHIHPAQWKMNDMKTCWHVEVYSNSHFGLIAPTTKQD